MLGSITPLGQRGRDGSWATTVAAYLAGSALAGAALGALLGFASMSIHLPAIVSTRTLLALLTCLLVAGVLVDLGVFHLSVPGPRRQVDEGWMYRYRGWVYGLGFGAQLGAGVVTVVTTSTVYVTFAACFLSGSPRAGLAVGAAFGLMRALPILSVRRVEQPDQLLAVSRWLNDFAATSRRLSIAAQGTLAATALFTAALVR